MSPINKAILCPSKYILIILFILVGAKGFSQITTNATDKVNALLVAHGKISVTRSVPTKVWVQGGEKIGEHGQGGGAAHWETHYLPVTTQEYLQTSKIRTIKMSNLEFGDDSAISLPDKFIETSQNFVNTSSINSTQQITLSLSFTRTTSISFTHSITHTTTFGSNFSLKLTDAFSLGGSVQVGESETNGTTYVVGENSTITKSSTVSATIPPKSAVYVSFKEWAVRHQVKFKCLVVIDADISTNDAGITLLSQIADEKSRTFEINGIIIADDCSEGVTTQSDPIKLTNQQIKNLSSLNLQFK